MAWAGIELPKVVTAYEGHIESFRALLFLIPDAVRLSDWRREAG
jgi:hypothetical protein